MKLSNRQKLRLGLAIMCVPLIFLWVFNPGCTVMQRVLGIGGNALLLLSVLLSYSDAKKHPENDR